MQALLAMLELLVMLALLGNASVVGDAGIVGDAPSRPRCTGGNPVAAAAPWGGAQGLRVVP